VSYAEKAYRQGEAEEGPSRKGKGQKEVDQKGGPEGARQTSATWKVTAAKWRGLQFGVDKSLRYHMCRRAHFEALHRLIMFGVLLSGSGVLVEIFHAERAFGAATVVLGAVDLVCGYSRRARVHQGLHHAFTNLAKQLVGPPSGTVELRRLEQCRLEIEAAEPPIFWAVEAECYNEAAIALSYHGHLPLRLTITERALKHWCRFEGAVFAGRN
jgi:hypothetical protein